MDEPTDDRRTRGPDRYPLIGAALSVLSIVYLVLLLWLLANDGAGLPDWVVVLATLPLIGALLAYALGVAVEFWLAYRDRRRPPEHPVGPDSGFDAPSP